MASFAETSFQFPASMNTNGFRMTNGFNEAVQSQQPQCGWLPNAPAKPLIVMNRMEWCQEDQSKEPTFTNGRKRSCDSLSLDDTKKVKTEVVKKAIDRLKIANYSIKKSVELKPEVLFGRTESIFKLDVPYQHFNKTTKRIYSDKEEQLLSSLSWSIHGMDSHASYF